MRFLLVLWVACAVQITHAVGQSQFVLQSQQEVSASKLVVDELGTIYLITSTAIERRNAFGGGSFRGSEMQWGDFHPIDVTDPLRPFVHFPASGKVVFFDNTLSMQGSPIDLFELGMDNIECMCGSRGDGFWLWDARNSELTRVDRSFRKLSSSGNLSMLLQKELHPLSMMERGAHLFVLTQEYSLLVFDIFGAWEKTLQLVPGSQCMADAGTLYVFGVSGNLQVTDTQTWLTQVIEMPEIEGRFSYQGGLLYNLARGRLSMYKHARNTRN